MKLSFDWLCDYVDLEGISAQVVADKLTMGAFEVEEVKKVGPDIEGPVVVGEILEIGPHPNADKIRLTKVRVEDGAEPLEIVCGAQNIEVGQRIPVALPGARVINRHDGTPLVIKAAPIRGVKSNGMLCSPPELGLTNMDSEGILILSSSGNGNGQVSLGQDVRLLLGLYPDYVLHVEPRSNRGDALSVMGLAREVAALCKRPLKRPDWSVGKETGKHDFNVEIENADDCPFFSIRVIDGVKLGPSPSFIARRLEAVGVRTVNNVVDITNYVMHETGQPLHAYDLRQVKGNKLGVRRARKGEKLTTLDEKERDLNDEVLVIVDGQGVVGVAGVMGGKDSEIADDTTALALEAASFKPARVRRSSRLLGLSSESSLRFERGVDTASVAAASDRATHLILTHCTAKGGSTTYGALVKQGNDQVQPVSIDVRLSQLKRLLDIELDAGQVKELLAPLGFSVTGDGATITVKIPSFRQGDVTREIDVIEEICRLYGYENIPMSMPAQTAAPMPLSCVQDVVRLALCGQGLSETWLSSLTRPDEFDKSGDETYVRVLNPLSEDHQVLRQSLIPGLLKAVVYNQDRGRRDIWLFEMGRTYARKAGKMSAEKGETGVTEQIKVAGVITGQKLLGNWHLSGQKPDVEPINNDEEIDFYRAKGIVENLIASLRIKSEKVRFFKGDLPGYAHPARSAKIGYVKEAAQQKSQGNGQHKPAQHPNLDDLGFVGEIHPGIMEPLGLRHKAYIFELNLDILSAEVSERSFSEIAVTPHVMRDLTVDVKEAVDHAAVKSCIAAAAGKTLTALDLVSIYQLNDDTKSLSYRLTFQDPQRTLTNEEVDKALEKVRKALSDQIGGSFRA